MINYCEACKIAQRSDRRRHTRRHLFACFQEEINMAGHRFRSVCMYWGHGRAAAIGVGSAQSGPGASVPTNGTSPTAANTYPTTVTVGASGTVATISVVLHNLVTDGNTRSSLCFGGLVLVAPSGKSMEIFGNMNGDCSDGGGLNLPTLTFQDGKGAVLPPNNGTPVSPNTTPKKRKPTAF